MSGPTGTQFIAQFWQHDVYGKPKSPCGYPCGINYWQVSERDDCPSGGGYYCSFANPHECAITSVVNPPPAVISPLYADKTTSGPVLANCFYSTSDFQTAADIAAFNAVFQNQPQGTNYTTAFNTLMTDFCSRPVINTTGPSNTIGNLCPVDPVTSLRMPVCSRFVASTPEADACRQWASSVDPRLTDAPKENYCATNTNNPVGNADCRCLNREEDRVYQAIQPGSPSLDSCWYIPCRDVNEGVYLQTTALNPAPGTCPTSVCETVLNLYNDKANQININPSNYISCSGVTPGGGGGGGDNGLSTRVILLVVGAIAIVILVIVIVVYMFSRHRRQAVAAGSQTVVDAPLPTPDPSSRAAAPPIAVSPTAPSTTAPSASVR